MKRELFTVHKFIDENAKEVKYAQCKIVLGTLGDCSLGFPVEKERFPPRVKVGDRFIWREGDHCLDKQEKDRKYKGDRCCEAIVGVDPKSFQPHLLKCDKPAVMIYFADGWNLGALLCQDCYDRVRNAAVSKLVNEQR